MSAPPETLNCIVGTACPNRCVFCCDLGHRSQARSTERRLEHVVKVLHAGREEHLLRSVTFTGLEPTTNPALPSMIAEARRLGYRTVSVVTNGRRLADAELLRTLVDAGLDHVILSLHGMSRAVYGSVTRRPEAFDAVLDALENLRTLRRTRPLKLSLSCVVCRHNLDALEDIVRAGVELQAEAISFSSLQHTGELAEGSSDIAVDHRDLAARLEDIVSRWPEAPVFVSEVPPCIGLRLGTDRYDLRERWHVIDTEGDVTTPEEGVLGLAHALTCRTCAALPYCEGVWASHAASFGWDAYAPVSVGRELPQRGHLPGGAVRAAVGALESKGWSCVDRRQTQGRLLLDLDGPEGERLGVEISPANREAPAFAQTSRCNVSHAGAHLSPAALAALREFVTALKEAE